MDDILNGSRVEPGEPTGEDVVQAHYRDLVELMDALEKDGFVADMTNPTSLFPKSSGAATSWEKECDDRRPAD